MTAYENFRQRLDAVLRTLDVNKVREFLITEKQWSADAPADPEFAMWLMIIGSPTLSDLHEQAREWLMTHGHAEEARIFLTRGKKPAGRTGGKGMTGRTDKGVRKMTGGKNKK
jgi:hypothetical protein